MKGNLGPLGPTLCLGQTPNLINQIELPMGNPRDSDALMVATSMTIPQCINSHQLDLLPALHLCFAFAFDFDFAGLTLLEEDA